MAKDTPRIVVIQDTREQTPWNITEFPVEVDGLPVGDYGIRGFSDWNNPAFIVERKSLSDLVGSLTAGRERFMREIEKMRQFRFRALIIEANRQEVEGQEYQSLTTPQSVLGSLDALSVRCGLHIYWAGGHTGAARQFEGLVRQFCRGVEKDFARLCGKAV
jgi:ERCC4-type nuclease